MGNLIIGGRYEILEKIGEGGMSVVYKAKCKLLNRFVAIKMLKPEFVKDQKFVNIFRKESQAVASLTHPNIVSVYDVGLEGKNLHYIVMEYVEGPNLSELIHEKGALPISEAIRFGKQIASALQKAHENNIIHRDIKPHNVLITKDGNAKVVDFGIAKAINTKTIVKTDTSLIGTVHYFSPEQARGGYVDEKSDIYSLGIVLYEMLTGKPPFDGDNPVSIAMKHINDEIIPPKEINSNIPDSLNEIVMRATAKLQLKRFPSAEALYEALDLESRHAYVMSGFKANEDDKKTMVIPKSQMSEQEQSFFDDIEDEVERSDKKKKTKKPKKKMTKKAKRIRIAAISLGVLLAIGGAFLVTKFLAGGFSKDVTVPKVVGMDYVEATALLKENNLNIKKDKTVYSDQYKKGVIISQDPIAAETVKEKSTIKVVVSKGQKASEVPDVVGQFLNQATKAIEDAGFSVGNITYSFSDTVADGKVMSQTPDAGSQEKANTGIDLVISKGPEQRNTFVPNVIGMDLNGAKSAIAGANLTLGTVTYANSDTYANNIISNQSVAAGTEVAEGSTINIVISNGPAPKPTPTPTPPPTEN